MYGIPLWRLALHAPFLIVGALIALRSFLRREFAGHLPERWSALAVPLGFDILGGGGSLTPRADERDVARGMTTDFAARLSAELEERTRDSVEITVERSLIRLKVDRHYPASAVMAVVDELMPTFRRSISGPDETAFSVHSPTEKLIELELREAALDQAWGDRRPTSSGVENRALRTPIGLVRAMGRLRRRAR